MNQRANSDDYTTYDLALTCALLTIGLPLVDLDGNDRHKTGFIFEDTDALHTAIKAYWNDQLQVNPRAYFNMLKDLKSRIYTSKRY